VVSCLQQEVEKVLVRVDVKYRRVAHAAIALGNTPAEFAVHTKAVIAKWAKVVWD
jgi:hypothetical protein